VVVPVVLVVLTKDESTRKKILGEFLGGAKSDVQTQPRQPPNEFTSDYQIPHNHSSTNQGRPRPRLDEF
jgi:hypothetical protein